MLDAIIRFSLRQRLLVAVAAVLITALGISQARQTPVDVFPDLDRPRVTVITEAHGMAPEEVESLISFPLETALNGATGVMSVRSSSDVGISLVYVDFDWNTDVYNNRQIVAERIALVSDRLPESLVPQLAPVSSLMGQVMMIGLSSNKGEAGGLATRTLADWVVRTRLLTIPGVAQVFVMGGHRKQFQVLVDAQALTRLGVSLQEVEDALEQANRNATGGYLVNQGPRELLVRSLGRVGSIDDLGSLVVSARDDQPVLLAQVARIIEGPQTRRGDSAVFVRGRDSKFHGGPSVLLTITKQPGADTRRVTEDVLAALEELTPALQRQEVQLHTGLYSQKSFIDRAISNVTDALWHGGVLVAVILLVFLINPRTTFIALTAIPLSLAITACVFAWFGLSINTMTLGGLAIAIGELVDDAIVGMENVYRRLRENRGRETPRKTLAVVHEASIEVRNPIVYSTMIVVLMFVPLFGLEGMEGRMFPPLAMAYIISILASLIVSLTLTPVLCFWLLGRAVGDAGHRDSPVLVLLRWLVGMAVRISIRLRGVVLATACAGVLLAASWLFSLESDFLPPFNEGHFQLNVLSAPGTSLETSNAISTAVGRQLEQVEGVESFVRRTGRAELDEHAEPVSRVEFMVAIDPTTSRSRAELRDEIRNRVREIPGIQTSVEQPLAHLISHMISGVQAQVGIKLYGDDIEVLRRAAERMKQLITTVDGTQDIVLQQQVPVPQLRIEIDRKRLAAAGLVPGAVNEHIETAMNGHVVSQILLGQRSFDLLVRLDEPFREDLESLRRLPLQLPGGGTAPLASLARIHESAGPNTVRREQARRRIVLSCNVSGRGLVDAVEDIRERLAPVVAGLPAGYFLEFSGQFQRQQSAQRTILTLSTIALLAIFVVLYSMFGSANLALQVLVAIPMAFIGGVAALVLTGQTLSIASLIGFISLTGIACRNGILLVNHNRHLYREEGMAWGPELLVRSARERVAPVMMTALTSGIGLLPLAIAAGEAGREILYPVATVIIGGLCTSTLLEFLVRPALFWTCGRSTLDEPGDHEPVTV